MNSALVRIAFPLLVLIPLSGCVAPRPQGPVTDPSPDVKIPAIKRAVDDQDPSAQRQLVRDLESDDPAVRFYAIYALEKLAGSRMGYEYFGEERARRAAVVRWQEWLKRQDQVSSAAASQRS